MFAKLQTIRILITIFLIKIVGCQDGLSEHNFLRLQQYSVNDGQTEAVAGYSTNLLQREPNSQSLNSVNGQYNVGNDNNDDYSRFDRGRSRKVYHIKNPFQQQFDDEKPSQDTNTLQDSATGASNQYAAMQYSLPPEDFLQKMRAENEYQQQQQQQQQLSTQVSVTPYTATPPPQYQYSTISASNYDLNQQSNQISTVEPKPFTPTYQSNSNSFQYNPYVYNTDAPHSTPIPPYLTTPIPNSQYLGTPTNNYVSSSSPIYFSSPPNYQQYVSSPFNIQSGTLEYNRVTTIGNNYDTNNDFSKAMQIDHYDNSANGVRYPTYTQNQYQTDFPSSTVSPNSSIYPDVLRGYSQASENPPLNALPKSEQGYSQHQYQNFRYNGNQRDNRQETNIDSSNSETHRIGSMPAANNLFLNYVHPEYQLYNSIKNQARDSESDMSQSDVYSHGDYGWRLSDKKSSFEPEISTKNNYFKYQIHNVQPETGVVSQVNFQMDSSRPYGYEQNIKPVSEKIEAEEFARAAAKAHENYKQQLESSKYLTNNQYSNNLFSNSIGLNSFYNNDDDKKRNKYSENSNPHGNIQSDIVTASSFSYMNPREVLDTRQKLPFDHDKALKNIVPIDASNIVQNSEPSVTVSSDGDLSSKRYTNFGYHKDYIEQNQKPYPRQVLDSLYKDKNTLYTIKSKPDEFYEKMKQMEQNLPYYGKHHSLELSYSNTPEVGNKRFVDELTQSLSFANQIASNHQDRAQPSANMHQRPQITSDIDSLLKFNDIPYRLTQNLNTDLQRIRNNPTDQGHIPTPLPIRINQNVDNHQLDVAAELLHKLMANKPHNSNINRPEFNSQSLSTINGFKVANPFNVDLKLVADMLKGKPAVDDTQINSLRGDLNKQMPLKFDISQLQQLLQLKNENNAMNLNNGLSSFSNSLYDTYNSGRFPYQGVKYSRSEEGPETIPIADSSHNHLIGAVIEEDDVNGELSEIIETTEDTPSSNIDDDRPKKPNSSHRSLSERHKHPSITNSNRYSYKRKYPKLGYEEPYPLLKPPPPHSPRHRTIYKGDKSLHRRRANKPKMIRVFKTEPLFEATGSNDDVERSISVAEDRSDENIEEKTV